MKHFVVFALLIFALSSAAQKQANRWYFGDHLGLNFASGNPVQITGGQTSIYPGFEQQGTTSLSDSAGNLLFYANAVTVWGRNHQVMPNGNGLMGCISASQAVLAVPLPGSSNIFYLFTVDGHDCVYNGTKGLRYSIIDMCLNNGMGDIVPGKKNIFLYDSTAEKITAGIDATGNGYWILSEKASSDAVYAYHLTAAGISNSPVISHIDTINGNGRITSYLLEMGQMKLSPNGRRLAVTKECISAAVALMDFDNSTGQLSNLRRLAMDVESLQKVGYGIEFSPNSRFLYAGSSAGSGDQHVFQYDITAGGGSAQAINASKVAVFTVPYGTNEDFGAFQQAPDNKIYLMHNNRKLDVINNPDLAGVACAYDTSAVRLSGNNILALPAFVAGLNYKTGLSFCANANAVRLNCIDTCSATLGAAAFNGRPPYSYHWLPGNYTTDTVTNVCPGTYIAEVSDAAGSLMRDTVFVTPIPGTGSAQITTDNTLFCAGDSTLICAPPGYVGYNWNNGATGSCISVNAAGNYYVTITDLSNCTAQSNSLAISALTPTQVAISINADTLSAYGANSYQWYLNGQLIDDATNSLYIADHAGSYRVVVTDSNGCHAVSDAIVFSGIANTLSSSIRLYPNPFNEVIYLVGSGVLSGGFATIYDVSGRKITEVNFSNSRLQLNTSALEPGVYFIAITTTTGRLVRQLVKQ